LRKKLINSMPYQAINYQKTSNIITINLIGSLKDRVELGQIVDELAELCDHIAWDETIKVVVLTGSEETSFSMGIDLSSAVSEINEGDEKTFYSLSGPVAKLDRPVVAAISGDAIGQGLELALACDIRIASETSCFGMSHIKSGLIPWDGGTQRLSRLVGRGKALEMILTGEVIGAQEALRIGLVNKVVAKEDLMEVTMKMAQEMASKGPIALRYTKEAIYKGMDMTLEQGLRQEADLYLLIHTSKDRTEGIQAFREKRTPKFEGK
jgi:enoyl-CoA hydratase/carnithine racemase